MLWPVVLGGDVPATDLTGADKTVIREMYHLWHSKANDIWPGAAGVPVPMVYVKASIEYAIGFQLPIKGFTDLSTDSEFRFRVQARPRTFAADISASFPIDGMSAVVIGTPAGLNKSPEAWVLVAEHEMFHVFQWANGSANKVASLNIAPADDAASWQLSFAFPYKNANVMRLIHLQGYPLWLAYNDPNSMNALYNVATALDAVHVYRWVLDRSGPKNYAYSEFQEWAEGVAKYTEYRFAELASRPDYKPDAELHSLPGYKGYSDLWTTEYQNLPYLVKHAGRAAQNRNAFYHLGMGKALALDKINPRWKTEYFAKAIWLDDLIASSLSQANK